MPIRTKISGTVCLARNYMASEALRVIKTRNFSETKMRRYSSVCKCNISKSENNHRPQLKSEIFGVAQARKKIYYYYYFFKIKILYIERAFFSTNASVNDFKLNYMSTVVYFLQTKSHWFWIIWSLPLTIYPIRMYNIPFLTRSIMTEYFVVPLVIFEIEIQSQNLNL